MEIVQSRYQNIFSRFYVMLANIFWYLVIGIPASIFLSTNLDIIFYIKLSLIFTIMFIAYLWVFHHQPSKRILIKDDGFEYFDYLMKREVGWREFKGFEITKSIPYRVIIHIENKENIEFGYYVFSSNQRKALFEVFNQRYVG